MPDYLVPLAERGATLLKKGAVQEIEFSGGTYQIQVRDSKARQDYWAFLQFDSKNRLKDAFCSCEEVGDAEGCVHLAAAYLRVFSQKRPLHTRFQESLWNRLFAFFAAEYGGEADKLRKTKQGCELEIDGEVVFSLSGLTPQGRKTLNGILFERPGETEETSLKFSNLSEEEIRLWRQGRPSTHLQYELSFWKDLAKWLMLLQDEGKEYTITFSYSSTKIPNKITIHFPDAVMESVLSRDCLNHIIPALSTVRSPLTVYGKPEEWVEKIVFDKDKGELVVVQKTFSAREEELRNAESLILGKWIYYPGRGFYPREQHPLLRQAVYTGREIADLLENYPDILKEKLVGVTIQEKPVSLSYSVSFDEDWSLWIEAYLFKPGDLSTQEARYFGEWAYISSRGFVPVEGVVFDRVVTRIPEEDVGDFVRQHRGWFNQQEGFHTHIAGVETRLVYTLTDDDRLEFTRLAFFEDGTKQSKDFGPWVYIKGGGFYSKAAAHHGGVLKSGLVLNKGQIPLFIRMYHDELALVEGFFSRHSPVSKTGLIVALTPAETISITPKYELHPEYLEKGVRFFEDYSFVAGEGFFKIPPHKLLPERFRYSMELDKENISKFFQTEFDQLQDYALWIDPRLKPAKDLRVNVDSLRQVPNGYELQIRFASGAHRIKFSNLWQAVKQKERYLFSDAGLIDLEEDRFNWIRRIDKKQVDRRSNTLSLSTLELLRLNASETLYIAEGKELLRELTEFHTPDTPNAEGLKSHLRPYQELGLRWLWFLYQHRLSGLLCDDMGLGKTHQAMGLMAAVAASKKEKTHFLVVCPTSVIYHWEEKLKVFLPHAKVCTFHGSGRSFGDFHTEYDILLTSYGIWRNEVKLLSEVPFEVAVFDEIQAAKNQKSRIHASLMKVKAGVRIGLTGTPIENRIRELKSLFDIILPHYMPPENEYKSFFVVPIEKENDAARRELLSRTIKPFVLRRKKEDVLLDLPEKTEEISHCELSLDQRTLYTDILHKVREGIERDLENRAAPIPYIHIFSALSSLKQICNHPAAFLKTPEEYANYQSGKWDLFQELLNEALESGQKVVVFSQYLAMLDIIQLYLRESQISFASIRGETVQRGEEVRRFNHDPECQVFLGSLQAAGLGIDLTAGSVVIHYDRWWNAAREDQATDRVHRIGQVRGVQVFKLVTKNTFEERIDEMITRKGKLMEDVVGVDDYRFMKKFDREEILQLFRDVDAR